MTSDSESENDDNFIKSSQSFEGVETPKNIFYIQPPISSPNKIGQNEQLNNPPPLHQFEQNDKWPSSLYDQTTSMNSDQFFQKQASSSLINHSSFCCRETINLDKEALSFKEEFYGSFGKTIFPKKFVQRIHNGLCNSLGIREINREEKRNKVLYFKHFSRYRALIIPKIREYILLGKWDFIQNENGKIIFH